ncbi:MAG: ABC transporter permease subunit [Planctomycetes bacterium]|nr:ABC transporter permease subunit [Planctomycetota bacterium]MBI3846587.1 ABC transporter permease subunit [Planctomycetota bacterium]
MATTLAASGTGPLSWGRSLRVLVTLGLRLAFQGKRALFVSLFLAAPVVLAIALRYLIPNVPRALASSDEMIVNLSLMAYAQVLVPFVCLLFGTSVVSEEWDDKTLTYLFTRPVRKSAVVVGKGIGMWLVSVALIAISFAITAIVIGSKSLPSDFQKHPMLVLQLLGILCLATLPYCALFVFLGTVLRRPLIPGLVIIFGLEKFLAWIPASVQQLAPFHYLRALLLPFADVSRLVRDIERDVLRLTVQPTPTAAIVWLLGFTLVFGALAGWVVSKREYLLTKE